MAESLCGHRRHSAGVLTPQCVADVQRIVAAASRARGAVKLQPLSCGRNWGFGSDLATTDDVYTLNLSALRRIRAFNLKMHCAEIEPGVTQGQLDDALEHEGGSHYFNVTGAGLGASVLGNALERGIGYSGQRHLDLLDLEVVLPTGELAHTSRFGMLSRTRAGLSGLGPDPTALFCQSNFGVVTAATIALHRRPTMMGGVLCRLSSGDRTRRSNFNHFRFDGGGSLFWRASYFQSRADCYDAVPAPDGYSSSRASLERRALDGAYSDTWIDSGVCRFGGIPNLFFGVAGVGRGSKQSRKGEAK